MGRQQDLITLNDSLDSRDFKFYLSNPAYGTLLLKHAPDGYAEDEFSFIRDMKTFGVFNKFAENELKFVKEGRDYVQQCYEAFGTNADVALTVWKLNYDTLVYKLRFQGTLDFSTYKISEISADVQVVDSSFAEKVLKREGVKVNLLGSRAIEGQDIGAPDLDGLIAIPALDIVQSALWEQQENVIYTDSHIMPTEVINSEFPEAATPTNVTGNDIAGALFTGAVENYTNLRFFGNVAGLINFDALDLKAAMRWNLNRYSAAGALLGAINIEIINTDLIQSVDFEFGFNETIPVLNIGEYLKFECTILYALGWELNYRETTVTLNNVITTIAENNISGMLYHEVFERLVAHYTGLNGMVYSEFFGRTDIGYAADGVIGAITPGRFIRNLSGTNDTFTTSLKELFESLSLYCIGYGIENGVLRVEPMEYFFQSNVVLNISDRIATETIVKEVIPDLLANSIKVGFNSFEYDRSGGIYEFNASSLFTTILNLINSFNIISPYRADTSGIIKLLEEVDQSKDVKGDEDLFLLDLVRDTLNYKLRTSEGFDLIAGGVDTDQNFNLLLTPARTIRRWGRYVRAMLDRWKLSRIIWQTSDKNTTLKTRITGEETVEENADIIVGSLAAPLWHPEKYLIDAYLTTDEFNDLQADPKGMIKLADDKFGWILNAKCNNTSKEIKLQILRANLAYVTPAFVRNGYLYNWFSLFIRISESIISYGFLYNLYAATDSRFICSLGWDIALISKWSTLDSYLGGSSVSGKKLKQIGTSHWQSYNPANATDEVAFSAVGGGGRMGAGGGTDGLFVNFKTYGEHWRKNGGTIVFFDVTGGLYIGGRASQFGASLRAFRAATPEELLLPDGIISSIYIGNDLREYLCTKIGNQIWTASNLAETKFRDGNWIAGFDGGVYTPISNAAWAAKTTAALCAFNDDLANVFGENVTLTDRMSPPGWHVPFMDELGVLYTDHLADPTKFNFVGLGVRTLDGTYSPSVLPTLWSQEEVDAATAMSQTDESASNDKNFGMNVRLFKNDPLDWSEGDVLIIDGVEYRTAQLSNGSVCMIDSLRTKKYADGSPIEKIVGNNAAWAADADGAYCSFNDDDSTV